MSLISVDELAARIGETNLRVADVRWYLNRPGAGRAAYEAGHIPSAIFVDLDTDLSDHDGYGAPGRHPLPSVEAFRTRMAELGIGSDDFVVAYDDVGGAMAARLWWMLDNLRHKGGVAVLDGGIQAWTAAGQPLSTDPESYPPADLVLAKEWVNVISRRQLAGRLGHLTLLDARAQERYRGEVEPIDPVAGHIPTAVNAPTADNVDSTGHFRPAAELAIRYGELVARGDPVVVACGSGTTACHDSLAMRVAGMPDPMLYVGSYSDWSRSGMPIAIGSEPGESPTVARD